MSLRRTLATIHSLDHAPREDVSYPVGVLVLAILAAGALVLLCLVVIRPYL